ncbi:hypothetical protein [Denitrobaculum tricleocarpae]|uniref:Uncharacterized protein n=1 Tax=Denitrobaculum tricleocarpae TaxID=2591009 RepID=A0A545TUE4_9PROT|nr:hypothetical protein [Denitrobaculum tricleocarpae]TQV80838.1 hypothetical protein FKG95_11865 [Denitrobaculum tricleocarpae]
MTKKSVIEDRLEKAARNLLLHCGGFSPGSEILILHEDPALGWYDEALPKTVARQAERLGLKPKCVMVGAPSELLDPVTAELSERYGNVIYFARIGDQDRFAEVQPGKTKIMCYLRNAEMLASDFATVDHGAMQSLKRAVDQVLLNARRIEITCPLGSRIEGAPADVTPGESAEVSIRRFPLGVPQPLDARGFGGRVALARYLTPTGSKAYEPAFLKLETPVFAQIEAGRIVSFSGDAAAVDPVQRHYDHVSGLFAIDPAAVHSWHAGIHPGCSYGWAAEDNPDRWSNTVFNNPRVLHFHTCGAYAPGEICWMLLDPSVHVDGTALWEQGRLRPERFPQTQASLDEWPVLQRLIDNPSMRIGV